MISINEGYGEDKDLVVVDLEDLGITIEILYNENGSIETDVLYGEIPYPDEVSKALYNGVLLFLTSLLTNGHCADLLIHKEQLTTILSDAFDKIPELSELINKQNNG